MSSISSKDLLPDCDGRLVRREVMAMNPLPRAIRSGRVNGTAAATRSAVPSTLFHISSGMVATVKSQWRAVVGIALIRTRWVSFVEKAGNRRQLVDSGDGGHDAEAERCRNQDLASKVHLKLPDLYDGVDAKGQIESGGIGCPS